MVTRHRGVSRLGCLLLLLVLVAAGYFAFNIGEVFYRYYLFRDAMRQEVRFAGQRTDAEIQGRLRATADSLSLPEEARTVNVVRSAQAIRIWADYVEHVDFAVFVREVRFAPRAEGPL